MDYLLLQIFLFLILAAAIGFFVGWLTRGFGFESRLLASENQWRSRQHILQTENNRLQAELDSIHTSTAAISQSTEQEDSNEELEKPQQDDATISLPFRSNQARQKKTDDQAPTNHPLDRLRNELSQITEEQTEEENEDESFSSSMAPLALKQADGEADDLKTIKGIGPKIESTLNRLGIFHFYQIADFTEDNINWINEHLQFKGRIERENWIGQAEELCNADT